MTLSQGLMTWSHTKTYNWKTSIIGLCYWVAEKKRGGEIFKTVPWTDTCKWCAWRLVLHTFVIIDYFERSYIVLLWNQCIYLTKAAYMVGNNCYNLCYLIYQLFKRTKFLYCLETYFTCNIVICHVSWENFNLMWYLHLQHCHVDCLFILGVWIFFSQLICLTAY